MRTIKQSVGPLKSGQQNNQRSQKIKIAIAVATVVIAVMAILFIAFHDKLESQVAQQITTVEKKKPIKPAASKQIVKAAAKKASWDMAAVKPVSLTSLANAALRRNDYAAVGQLSSSALNMKMNIYVGVGNTELNLGAGTLKKDDVMGIENYALAGHNMDDGRTLFSPLYTAAVRGQLKGVVVDVTDWVKVYHYKVVTHRFVSAYSLDLAGNTLNTHEQPILTLFTCDWTGRGRLYIQAQLDWTTDYTG